jgi:outer membrane protein assembly factor BamA
MALAGGLNGSLSEAQVFGVYSNLSRRLQYSTGVSQEPVFYSSSYTRQDLGGGILRESQGLNRYIYRSVFASAQYPFDRFRRIELGLAYSHVDRGSLTIARDIVLSQGRATNWYIQNSQNQPGVSFLRPSLAYVQDNTMFGYTGPIMGSRLRAQVEPAIGGLRWLSYFLDARRYEPVVFNFITLAGRVQSRIATGRDEEVLPAYIGDPGLFRGYNRQNFNSNCDFTDIANPECSASRLLGSRVFVGSAEIRFPLIRNVQFGFLPFGLPPIDGVGFFDVGMAWNGGDATRFFSSVPADQASVTRYPLRSYGYGLRLNLFNLALLRWDYAIPLDLQRRTGFWSFSIGPSW